MTSTTRRIVKAKSLVVETSFSNIKPSSLELIRLNALKHHRTISEGENGEKLQGAVGERDSCVGDFARGGRQPRVRRLRRRPARDVSSHCRDVRRNARRGDRTPQ